ncbi:MAG: hypothetical protein KC431_09620, partial [Myxococcales bacterium]|nr:hypothetical protein [Myxococcales bacterium]
MLRAGFDEAGLGPTLGPLVVAGFATSVTGGDQGRGPIDDLRGPLAALVGEPGARGGKLEVGDSKKIHTGPRKLARVERTALATVAWIHGVVPATVAELFGLVVDTSHEVPGDRKAPWWASLDEALPIVCQPLDGDAVAHQVRRAGEAAGRLPLWYRADVLSAARINRELVAEEARVDGTKNTWAT